MHELNGPCVVVCGVRMLVLMCERLMNVHARMQRVIAASRPDEPIRVLRVLAEMLEADMPIST